MITSAVQSNSCGQSSQSHRDWSRMFRYFLQRLPLKRLKVNVRPTVRARLVLWSRRWKDDSGNLPRSSKIADQKRVAVRTVPVIEKRSLDRLRMRMIHLNRPKSKSLTKMKLFKTVGIPNFMFTIRSMCSCKVWSRCLLTRFGHNPLSRSTYNDAIRTHFKPDPYF